MKDHDKEFLGSVLLMLGVLIVVGYSVFFLGLRLRTTRAEATESARHWAVNVPGATGEIVCADDWGEDSQYCTIVRANDVPLSVRCDEETCTTMGKAASTTVIHTGRY